VVLVGLYLEMWLRVMCVGEQAGRQWEIFVPDVKAEYEREVMTKVYYTTAAVSLREAGLVLTNCAFSPS
jgi:hypothetical protein